MDGKNLILFGDAVGNGHWAGAGGLETAIVNHGIRLKELLLSLQFGLKKELALKRYSSAVTADSMEWLKISTASVDPQWRKHSSSIVQATGKAICQGFMFKFLSRGL